jgi:diguanylate cyclase (GGDEF)-like protein
MSISSPNRRILVIDDNTSVLEDFRKVLTPDRSSDQVAELRAALFGHSTPFSENLPFEVECVTKGQEGYELVKEATRKGAPFAVAFVDMRMPAGWDGLETIEHLWEVDAGLQVVICTAFSDHTWDTIRNRVGQNDKLLILQKPFQGIEVSQLANALGRKWDLARKVAGTLDELNRLVAERTAELQRANNELTTTNATLKQTVADLELAQEEIMRQNKALEQLASRDPLTGCFNRRVFFEQLEKALAESLEHKAELSCVMVDIDHFKGINDQFGHAVGDQSIQAVARSLTAELRLTDVICRYGGEEFCLIFPRTTLAEACVLAERLRERLQIEAGSSVRAAPQLSITVSCGVASTAFGAETPLALIDQADKALYAAKEGGRNCVMALDPIVSGPDGFRDIEPQVKRITPRVPHPITSR